MPLTEKDLPDVQRRVWRMLRDTIATFEVIEQNAEVIYGDKAPDVRAAINECLDDFLRNTGRSGEKHPEQLIFETPRENFQRAGFYGAQLYIKERQVTEANAALREPVINKSKWWKKPFSKWVDIINNFLRSLVGATGLGEALEELKDCLRGELPEGKDE